MALVTTPASQPGQSAAGYRAGEVLVRFRPEVSEADKSAVAETRGTRRNRPLRGSSRVERLELRGGQTPQMLASQLADEPSVEWAEPNYLIARDEAIPNDPRFTEQWALRNDGSHPGADIAAPVAWEKTTGSTLTVIAVIDSGIDFAHPDLTNNQWVNLSERANARDDDHDGYVDDLNGWDWVAGSNQIRDEQGHGTAVAGIIASEGNNRIGTTGVMWRAGLMSLRVLDSTGTGDVADAVEAIDYAVEHGARVINLSWGLATGSLALKGAIERAGYKGVVVVCSSGNGGNNVESSPYYPSSYDLPNIISVAATDNGDNLASWSNWGATHVAIGAPGVDVLTTKMGGDYYLVTGTSAAAPFVAGIAGLVKTLYPALSAPDTRSVIISGARRVSGLSGKVASDGMAHAAGALAFAGNIGYAAGNGSGAGGNNSNGNGGNNGAGNGNGNGGNNGHAPSLQPGAPGHGSGGHGPGGSFNVTPPEPLKGAPANFQDQNEARRRRPEDPKAPTFIHSNLLPDCGVDCGGNTPGGAGGTDPYFAVARTLPQNRTGETPGVDPGSRNFNWSMPLVNLTGRAGLDLNIALHYNSLVWTREGSRGIMYNADHGFPGPGFRLGFPVVQTQYLGGGGPAYLLETSSGGREELRRLGGSESVSNTYEAPDGSNTQLIEYYQISNRLNSKCLNVASAGAQNGASLQQWDCNGASNQQWQIVPTDSGYYKILARHSGKAVDVEGAYTHDGAAVHQWEYVGGANQQWRFEMSPNFYGYYHIIARNSNKALTADYSYDNGANIYQWTYPYGDPQLWRLDPVVGQMVVRTVDGTQLSFAYNSNVHEYRCIQIKDRNGNYITINYDPNNSAGALGRPTSVVDTLGRVLTFNYDAQKYLRSITQPWRRESVTGATVIEQHAWATFDYEPITIQTNFRDANNNPLILYGPGTSPIPVLSKLGLPDGTKYAFDYTVWGQVNRIRRLAPDDHLLARESYNLPTDTITPQPDCPRMSERRDWAQGWNNDVEAVTNYAETQNHTWQMPNLSYHTGTMTQVASPIFYVFEGTPRQNVAYRVVQRTYAHATGWDNGLPILERTYQQKVSTGEETLRRTTWRIWTQDNPALGYPANPRPVEINIDDPQGNRKRTTIQYTTHGLPEMVREWGGTNASQVLRRTYYQYRWDAAYVSRRMIGLPSVTEVFEGESTLVSKLEYHYDWDTHFTALAPSTQHDGANYGASFIYGRGQLVGVRRYNKDAPGDANQALWPQLMGYDLAGSTLWTQDGAGHRTSYDYADSFWTDSTNTRNTRAYPTRITDPDNYFSTAEYNYDLGAATRTENPPAAGQTQGTTETMRYDGAGRIERVSNPVSGAYTRYEYDPNQGHTRTFATTKDVNSIAYTNTIRDGAGQVSLYVATHPGSVGGYRAVRMVHDALGRVVERTNMTEITGGGVPTGDDAAGYQRTLHWYDWKGRPTLTTFPNGNTVEADYGGCGCAGGEVTTTRDERGRRRKLYKDTLGRLAKVEEMNWLESQGVYATTYYTYNARDQITQINQGTQVRSSEYDGHGRLLRKTTPEQGVTTYAYNADDMVHVVTDARNASTTFTYNGRHLPTFIDYAAAGGASETTDVTLGYDAAGNRTSMTDGLGSVSYSYNQLSRLTSETRTFTGVGAFTLSYEYNLAGSLTRVTNPWGAQVAYTYDTEGRALGVNGQNTSGVPTYGGVSDYVSGLQYRAFDGLKQSLGGNLRVLTLAYDTRMRLSEWKVAGVLGWNYQYDKFGENSNRVTYARNLYDSTLNRSYDYDQVGRLWEEHSGNEADAHVASPAQPFPSTPTGPLSHSYRYDQYGNMTYRVGWGGTFGSYTDQVRSFTDNRQDGLIYDVAGNLTNDGAQYTYDVTGQQVSGIYPAGWGGYANYSLQQSYDGDRLRAKKVDNGETTYALRSSVLGSQVVAELKYWNGAWGWTRGYVYLGGQLIAIQSNGVTWVHQDPVVKSQRLTGSSGNISATVELDAWGGETDRSVNSQQQPRKFTSYERDGSGNDQAMMRQYHSYWMRFDQPDPYGGSYDVTDPQSLNRYNYVQNDPVNFVDPSGLLRIQQCTVDWRIIDGQKVYGAPYNCRVIWDDGEFSGGILGATQTPTRARDNRTACDRMADDAQRIAEERRNAYPNATAGFVLQQFNKAFGNLTFGSYFTEGPLGFLGTPASGRNVLANRDYQGDSGFHADFRDTLRPGEDQVHHFGAYFSAGLTGHKVAPDQHRGDDRDAGNAGDVRLSDQSRWLGDYLRRNPGQLNQVGQLIRDTICKGGAVPK